MRQTFLSHRFQSAVEMAVLAHGKMKRKGDGKPYIIHPFAVCALLLHWKADEDTCIAGLLHDVIEDAPDDAAREHYRRAIGEQFGKDVLETVESVTEQDKSLTWKVRKERYLAHLERASVASLLVCCADKTHNAFSLLAAYRAQGEGIWGRFNASKAEKLWFHRQVFSILQKRLPRQYLRDFALCLDELERTKMNSLPSAKTPGFSDSAKG